MPDQTNDVKPDTASSAVQPAQTTDAKVESTPASSAESKPELSASEALAQVVKESLERTSSQDDKKEGETEIVEKKEEEGENPEASSEVEEKQTEEKVDKGPIPYDRFQQVNTVKVELEKKLAEVEPLVAAHKSVVDFCMSNNISNEEFETWLNVAALTKTNPAEALKQLKAQVDALGAVTGAKLPPDLQQAVDNGEITEAIAKRLAAAEGTSKFAQVQSAKTQEQYRRQQEQQHLHAVQTGMQEWVSGKAAKDVDFKPKSAPTDPDGKFEFVVNKIAAEAKHRPIKDVADLLKLADEAYIAVENSLKRFAPVKPTRPNVSSTRTTTSTTNSQPKSLVEALGPTMRKHGLAVPTT